MNRTRHRTARGHVVGRPCRGMTLLEVMLSLSLTTVVLVAISMAIDLHLKTLDSQRGTVERIQLARAVLNIIARDLRATIQQNTTDFSGVAGMVGDAAGDLGDLGDLGDAGGDMGALDDALADLGTDETAEEGSIADSTAPPAVPGLYGNQYELQVDISRLPRVDEYEQMVTASLSDPLQDIPSDVKTVAYYLQDPSAGTSSSAVRDRNGEVGAGLVRRALDRAVTLYASENGSSLGMDQVGELLAPEVNGLEFQYFDGLEWVYEWDSEEMGGLPMAVRITISVMSSDVVPSSSTAVGVAPTEPVEPDQIYSLVVRLPTALPTGSTEGTEDSGMESVGL